MLLVGVLAATVGGLRCDRVAAAQPAPPVAAAVAVYRERCAMCHDQAGGGAPRREALAKMAPAAIARALTDGVMREQASGLTAAERAALALYLGQQGQVADGAPPRCAAPLRLTRPPTWNRWGNGLDNRRFQTANRAGMAAADVGRLKLAWAFAFPGAARARSQPAVTPDALFTGSQSGRVYAFDPATGCLHWQFDAAAEVRSAPTIGTDAKGRPDRLFFGDFDANVYAVDAASGRLIWKRSVRDHPAGTITGAPTLAGGRLFVPMSSTEVVSAYNPQYECCTFRGGLTALDAGTGALLWRNHTVDPPRRQGSNPVGRPAHGPSGAPIWSSPTIDARRGLIYVGTGENYSSPAGPMSDAIIAIDQATGAIRWVRQTIAGDSWNAACGPRNNRVNCPVEDGPDFDFGAPPILVSLAGGRDLLLAGQKSGMIYAMDPARRGRILWQRRAGMGGFNGGVHWGMASDGRMLVAGIADTPGHTRPSGPPRQGLHAFDVTTGRPLWSKIEPDVCAQDRHQCRTALSAPVTMMPGVVFAGALNGLLRAYSATDGRVLWSIATDAEFLTINGIKGHGGGIDSAGPVVADGRLIVNSGYDKFGQIPGNLLMVFAPAQKDGAP